MSSKSPAASIPSLEKRLEELIQFFDIKYKYLRMIVIIDLARLKLIEL
jgi:hypothetical protein